MPCVFGSAGANPFPIASGFSWPKRRRLLRRRRSLCASLNAHLVSNSEQSTPSVIHDRIIAEYQSEPFTAVAAAATVAALEMSPGIYNIVDDDPSPIAAWLPAFAKFIGAPAPLRVSEQEAVRHIGADAAYYAPTARSIQRKSKERVPLRTAAPRVAWRLRLCPACGKERQTRWCDSGL